MRSRTITCPAGQMECFEPGQVVEFDPEVCGSCTLRAQCTHSANGKGRTVSIAKDERLQKKLRVLQSSEAGRTRLRQRVGVEHRLAHIAARQGRRARYIGVRKTFSICDEPPRSRISKPFNAGSQHDYAFNMFGALVEGLNGRTYAPLLEPGTPLVASGAEMLTKFEDALNAIREAAEREQSVR